MALEYIFTPGKRIDSRLLYTTADRQLFNYRSSERNGLRYVCHLEGSGCRARLNLDGETLTYLNSTHSHGHQESQMKTYKLEHDIKVRTRNENGRPKTIFEDEVARNEDVGDRVQFGRMRRSLNKNRKKGIPNNPKTVQEVESFFADPTVQSKLFVDSSSFYKCTIITEVFAYVIFASESILSNLPPVQKYLIDGTFKVVPAGPFKQLLTISLEDEQHLFPVFYVLTTHRSEAAYDHLFKHIKQRWNVSPQKFMSDYERALRNALRNNFPGIPIRGCWFHFTQAVRRKASQIAGFFDEIWQSEAKKQFFHKILALPLMKETEILSSFAMLKDEVLNFENPCKLFLKYFERQWLRREGPSNICVYWELNRTNNLSESYNSYLNKKMKFHGSLFDFVDVLLKEEKRISRDYRVQSRGGDQVFVERRKRYKIRDEFIRKVQRRFEDGLFDIKTFFNKITFRSNNGSIRDMDYYDIENECDLEFGSENEEDLNEVENVAENEAFEDEAVGASSNERNSAVLAMRAEIEALRSANESLRNVNSCVICLERQRNRKLIPCRHVVTCNFCAEKLLEGYVDSDGNIIDPRCPVCRSSIESVEPVSLKVVFNI